MKGFRYEVGYVTHPGNRRSENQDSLLVRRGSAGGAEFLLLAVADGMGGLARGGEASSTATQLLDDWWRAQLPTLFQGGELDWAGAEDGLAATVEHINWTIRNGQGEDGGRSGTTLTLCLVFEGKYLLLHVGDSRAYLVRPDGAHQLSRDQTWCGREVAAGRLTPEAAAEHPMRHILLSSLGVAEGFTLQRERGSLRSGWGLLLCSDGFYQELDPALWPALRAVRSSPQAVLDEGAALICAGIAGDNLTGVLLRTRRLWGWRK